MIKSKEKYKVYDNDQYLGTINLFNPNVFKNKMRFQRQTNLTKCQILNYDNPKYIN